MSTAPLPLLLALDASTALRSVALFRGPECLAQTTGEARGNGPLFDDITRVLAEADVAVTELTHTAIGLGPGSFSGIRAALAAMQGLCLPLGTRPIGISSGAAMAQAARRTTGTATIAVVGDARRRRLWLGLFSPDTPATHTADDYTLLPLDALAAAIPPQALIISPDAHRIGDLLARTFTPDRLSLAPSHPSATDVATLALPLIPHAHTLPPPLPIYLHPAVATRPHA